MKYIQILFFFSALGLLSSCIGDDFIEDEIDPVVRVNNAIDTLAVGTQYQFEITFFNNIGQQENAEVVWESSDANIISITSSGLATANEEGSVQLTASVLTADGVASETLMVAAGESTTEVEMSSVRSGVIRTTTFYDLEGDFELLQNDDGTLTLDIASNYRASAGLPGLYVYLTNNPRSISGAFEIGRVNVFSGAHSYNIDGVEISEYNYLLYFCKPFNVKVGDAEIN